MLLIETADGLVLVDTGFGLEDVRDPVGRLGRIYTALAAPRLTEAQTAIAQIEALGLSPDDVRHIVLTHGDSDHGGGLADFPKAKVHLFAKEHAAIMAPAGAEKVRYASVRRLAQVDWQTYPVQGEPWMGFEAVRDLVGLPPEILMIPLPGHTRGHVAVAVDTGAGWLLHAGDAYFHGGQMLDPPFMPAGLGVFQKAVDQDGKVRAANQERLRQLALTHRGEVSVFCAHDPVELARVRGAQAGED